MHERILFRFEHPEDGGGGAFAAVAEPEYAEPEYAEPAYAEYAEPENIDDGLQPANITPEQWAAVQRLRRAAAGGGLSGRAGPRARPIRRAARPALG